MHELEVVNIRLVREPSLYSETPVTSPESAIKILAKELAAYDREAVFILNLQSNGKVINLNIVSLGTVNSALISSRELFKSSILSNAASVIVIHNHPGGSLEPSQQDIQITRKIQKGGEILDIPLLDHIIVAGVSGKTYSFRDAGLLENQKDKVRNER